MTNADKLKLLSTKDLLAKYNELTGKSIKRFSSRDAGEKQTLAAMTAAKPAAAKKPKKVAAETTTITAPAETVAAAQVKVMKENATQGRPNLDYKIELSEGVAKVRDSSLRGKIMAYLRTAGTPKQVALSALVTMFGVEAKGAVQKLTQTKWLRRIDE